MAEPKQSTYPSPTDYRDKPQADKAADQLGDQETTGIAGCDVRHNLHGLFEENARSHISRARDYRRGADLLRAHPEFEDFLWLIRSGLVMLVLMFAMLASAQAPTKPEPAKAPEKPPALTTEQQKDVQLAIKDYQIAELQREAAQAKEQSAQAHVMQVVAQKMAELKLDDTWTFNYQTMQPEKKPEPKKGDKK